MIISDPGGAVGTSLYFLDAISINSLGAPSLFNKIQTKIKEYLLEKIEISVKRIIKTSINILFLFR